MKSIKYIRLNPEKLISKSKKYILEDKITSIIMKELYNIDIQYINPLDNYIFNDVRYQKIYTLFNFSTSDIFNNNFIYLDHDVIIDPSMISLEKINFTYGLYKNKASACIIDFKIINNYKKKFNKEYHKHYKNINYEEDILTEIIKSIKNIKHITPLIIHYNTDVLMKFILKHKNNLSTLNLLIKLTQELRREYEKNSRKIQYHRRSL